ncbi:unannotated protein [freshwater metagenome]|uniref:Unannotated protein n=1 Tax=freshwater metagenome TaxID=449393 RepID=A0A6J7FAG2_9ZZZZ|nr:hypothetical protein [Actinomycetota bacterium]
MRIGHGVKSMVVTAFSVAALSVVAMVGFAPAVHAEIVGLGAGGEYHPLTPDRIYDTRPSIAHPSGINSAGVPIVTSPAGGFTDVQILGRGGVPDAAGDVLAVVVSITVTGPSSGGYLQAYPSGAAAGISSVVNFAAGQTVPNLTVATVGANGKLTVRLSTPVVGTADILIDVFGWFSTSAFATNGARFIPVGPGRIWDTREASFNGTGQPIGQAQTITVPIRGADSQIPATTDIIPNDPNVVGVVLNVTGINTEPNNLPTFVSVLPESPGRPPTTSNLNLGQNQIKANLVIVPVTDADGAIRIYNSSGRTHVAVDVVGYMMANVDDVVHPRQGRVIPLTAPFRAFDTRDVGFGNAQLGPGQAEAWSFSQFVASVTLGGQPVGNQLALLGNLTGTGLTRVLPYVPVASFFTMYPGDVGRPLTSNINLTEGVNVPNMAVLKLGANSQIKAFNSAGYVHYLFDVSAVVLGD